MDTPKLQPITNKLKHNSGNAKNGAPVNEGAAGTGHGGNARFNNGSSGSGPNANGNDGPHHNIGPNDRRFNYYGPPRKECIGDRPRNKYINHSEPYHRSNYDYSQRSDQPPYHASQWYQNRYNNKHRWSNEYNYNNGNNFNTNSNYPHNEPRRRRDNTASPYNNESNRKSLSTERNVNNTIESSTAEKLTESTPTDSTSIHITTVSSNVERIADINSPQIYSDPDKRRTIDSNPAEISQTVGAPRITEVRTSPRKRPAKKNQNSILKANAKNFKLSPNRVKKKSAPQTCRKNPIENANLSNLSNYKDEKLVAVSDKDNINVKKNEQSSSKNIINNEELNSTRSAEQNKTQNSCIDSIENNSLNLPTDSVKEKRKLSKKNCGAKSKGVSLKSRVKKSNVSSKPKVAKLAAKENIDTRIKSTNENKTDETEENGEINLSKVAICSQSIPNESNVQSANALIDCIENEKVIETPQPNIPDIDVDLNSSDLSEVQQNKGAEVISLECGDLPLRDPNDKPRISIIPLSRLIRNELLELTDESSVTEIEDVPPPNIAVTSTPSKRICRPNLVKRRRQISSCSTSSDTTENLIDKVVGMNKYVIKEVINNSGTRYDEALKAQARKRLREEIRKQLKSMNLETAKDSEDINFVPDDIVDAICIPDIVLDEIRKAFGVEIVYKGNVQTTDIPPVEESVATTMVHEEKRMSSKASPPLQESLVETTSTAVQSITDRLEKPKRIVVIQEVTKQNKEASPKERRNVQRTTENPQSIKTAPNGKRPVVEHKMKTKVKVKKEKEHRISTTSKESRKKDTKDVILIDSSSSNSSLSSSSSSGSDTESESSTNSTSSSVKRHRLKLRVDAQNIVESFEKLILPSLSESLKLRYRTKFSNSTYTRLHFISCICTSEYNTRKFTKNEVAKIQSNLKSEDRSVALEFLMREIVNVFHKQKEAARRERGGDKSKNDGESTRNRCYNTGGASHSTDKANGISTQAVKYTRRGSSSSGNGSAGSNRRSANAAEKFDDGKNCVQSSRIPTPTKKQHQSVNGQTLMNKRAGEGEFEKSAGNAKDAVSYQHVTATTTKGNGTVNEQHNTSTDSANTQTQSTDSSSSVGMQTPPTQDKLNGNGASNPFSGFENSLNGICGIPSLISGTLFPNADLETMWQRNLLNECVVSSLREHDLKLIELHKRKMFLEEMILKLQKEKMEVDRQTMHVQNEKFVLLNGAISTAANELPRREASAAAIASSVSPWSLLQNCKAQSPFSLCTSTSTTTTTRAIQTTNSNNRKRKANDNNGPNVKRKRGPRKRGARNAAKQIPIENTTTEAVKTPSPPPKSPIVEAAPRDCTPSPIISDIEPSLCEIELPPFNYADMPCGEIEVRCTMTQVHLFGRWIIATGEDGRLYKFSAKTLKKEMDFAKHNEAITHSYLCHEKKVLYTASLDGYMKKTSLEDIALDTNLQSVYLQEPLQCMEMQWGVVYVGSRWGNVFSYDIASNTFKNSTTSADTSICAIKATTEGPRRILIVASKSQEMQIRDASSGLLLRIINLPEPLKAYNILLDDGCIYCGTQRSNVLKLDFTTGQHMSTMYCGNGAASMRLYQNKFLLIGSYDGFVYVLDKAKDRQCGRYAGGSGIILTLAVVSNKMIVSTKEKSMKVIELPQNISTTRN